VAFRSVRDSTAGIASGNGVNNVIWGDNVFGQPFGDSVVAVTRQRWRTSDNVFLETDVIVNRAYGWNSYRGDVRRDANGNSLVDLRRVALHEFGHVLGLNHPDQHGQSVPAIMNSRVSNIDNLQTDDINGARAIYGAVTAPLPRDTLQSGAQLTGGQALTSNNGRFRLTYQGDGNLVLYDGNTPVWASRTGGTSVGRAEMQSDGNFVIYDGQGTPRFATATPGNAGAFLVVQGDGNVVVYRPNGQPVWDRFNNP
jgi:hypothetical protein